MSSLKEARTKNLFIVIRLVIIKLKKTLKHLANDNGKGFSTKSSHFYTPPRPSNVSLISMNSF